MEEEIPAVKHDGTMADREPQRLCFTVWTLCFFCFLNVRIVKQPDDHRLYSHLKGMLHDGMTQSHSHLRLIYQIFIYNSLSFVYTVMKCL